VITNTLPEPQETLQEPLHDQRQSGPTRRILLVEDNPINQEVAVGSIELLGYQVTVAADGYQALYKLVIQGENPFDLVLMDCQMPGLDGYETTRIIRRNGAGEYSTEVPIVAMTANAMQGDREKCIDAGMNDYMSKPIDPDELEAKLDHWCSQKPYSPAPSEGEVLGDTQEGSDTQDKGPSDLTDDSIWKREDLLRRVRGKQDRVNKLIQSFLKNSQQWQEESIELLEQQDLAGLEQLAHNIKGVSANLGAGQLQATSEALEAAVKNQDYTSVKTHCQRIPEQYQRLRERLEAELQA